MEIIAQSSLYFSEGRSDKEYHAEIVEVCGGNIVNFRYGRRGGALTSGTKTSSPVEFTEAKRIFDKLVKVKTAKGYTPDVSGAVYQNTEHTGLRTGFMLQLLNSISEHEAVGLIADSKWAAQQKMDGERRAAHAENGYVIGINRRGLIVPLPQAIVDELQAIDDHSGEIRIDGEIIGDVLHVFDLHIHRCQQIHATPWIERMRLAESVLSKCRHIKAVPIAVTTDQKSALWNEVVTNNGEGVVFKRLNSPVTEGRPNSGGNWLKFKFTESATCCVLAINPDRRSVLLGLLELSIHPNATVDQMTPVGNVTIPPNHDVPVSGDIVEVEYLYAFEGGSLFQPVYRGKRRDQEISACIISQLKIKPEACTENRQIGERS